MTPAAPGPGELVVCSLEAWDEVWRRNQFLVQGLLERDPSLRVLFVEPPFDLVHGIRHRRLPSGTGMRMVGESGRLSAFRPVKPLPRLLGPWTDRALCAQARSAARRLGFTSPVLWINDVSYAPLAAAAGWPTVYDVTDDWLLEPVPARELARRRRLDHLLLEVADAVVVCSPALAASRGASRPVTLIPNGVDVAHFRTARPRPPDLPPAPVAVYVGTLHDERLDVDLVTELAKGIPGLAVVLVGPDALSPASRQRLDAAGVRRLGSRPYHDVPAYLRHADVIVVPHRVTPFTESLDPIKAYECLAVGRPTVATPVAGFRDLDAPVQAVPAVHFVATVAERLDAGAFVPERGAPTVVDWAERVVQVEHVLGAAAGGGPAGGPRAPRYRRLLSGSREEMDQQPARPTRKGRSRPLSGEGVQVLDRVRQKVLRSLRPPDSQLRGMYVGDRRVLLRTKAGPLLAASDDLGIMPSLALYGTFEDELADWLTEVLVAGDTFVDIGANIGWFTVIGAKSVGPSGKVVAVEADVRNYELLLDNLSMNYVAAHTDPVLGAAAAEAGTVTLYRSGSFRGSSSTVPFSSSHRRAFPREQVEAVEVPALVLDDLLDPYGPIAVLKMDIEGGEAAALSGLRRLLEAGRIEKLVLEINKDAAGSEWAGFVSWLYGAERAGWRLYDLAGGAALSARKAVEIGWFHAVVLSR